MLSKHFNPLDSCEIKMTGDKGFAGYASVFGSVDSYGDTVAKGAFKTFLESRMSVPMLFGHSPNQPIGKWLRMEEDDKGLYVEGEFTPGNRNAQDIAASVKHGAISGLSIGFMDRDSEALEGGGRLLKDIDLREVSVVTFPAEQLAQITSVKSRLDHLESLKDCEAFLRDAGMSRTEAAGFISRIKDSWQSEFVAEVEAKLKQHERIKSNTEALVRLIQDYA